MFSFSREKTKVRSFDVVSCLKTVRLTVIENKRVLSVLVPCPGILLMLLLRASEQSRFKFN